MKFLFSHRNFPAQFRHILFELSKNPENEIVFITGTKNNVVINNVKKYEYTLKRKVPDNCHRYLRDYEEAINHGISAAEAAIWLREQGFVPDVMYAHAWGNSLFLKDVYPDVPLLLFCEWFYKARESDVDFVNKELSEDTLARIRCKNAQILTDLTTCDKGICPTNWQKSQFPKEFNDKIEVIHDGIDTDYFTRDDDVVFQVPNSDITFTRKDKIVTYATRGMEPYRGFPQFMQMAEKLLKKRKDVNIIIAGEDRVCYGERLADKTYKELMLEKLDLDLSRVHFTGGLIYREYKKLLQLSSAHVYLTYPFVLSWSMLEAMSAECCIIASKTPPVEEVMKDNYNGILVDFFDVDKLLKKVEYALDNPNKVENIRKNARRTIVDKYDLKVLLKKHIDIITSLAQKKKS